MSNNKSYRTYSKIMLASAAASMAIAPIVSTADSTINFVDVNERTVPTTTEAAIYELVEMGAIKGYPDGTFKPNRPIIRAQVAKIFTGAFGLSLPENLEWALKDYSDITPHHEYAEYIAATTVTGLFKGNKGKFDAWSPITRGQMAIVLGRILKDYNTVENVEVNLNNISDDAKEGVQIIANLGVTTELHDYRPDQHVTRAQFAAFAHRALTVIDESN